MRLVLPHRGDFGDLDDALRANFRAIERWAEGPRDALQLVNHVELPHAADWPEHALVLSEGKLYRNTGEDWELFLLLDETDFLCQSWSTSTLTAGVRPHRWPVPVDGVIRRLDATLDTDGSTDTVIDLLVNTVSILEKQLTIPAGENQPSKALAIRKTVAERDQVQIEIVSAGTGALDLTVDVLVEKA